MPKEPRKRPGGRNEVVRRAVVAAVLDAIRDHGLEFNHVDVAERAGVHHTTVYRRWPAKADLLREAMGEQYRQLELRRTGDFVSDLHAICQHFAAYAAEPVQRIVFGYAIVSESTDVADLLREYWFPLRREMEAFIQEGIDSGQLAVDTDPFLFVQLLIGPLILVPLFTRRKLQRRQVQKIVDRIVLSHAAAHAQKRARPRRHVQKVPA